MHRILLLVAVSAGCVVSASADELPARKAGLWESKTVSTDGTSTGKQCVGEGTDAAAVSAFGGGKACSKKTVTRTADGWTTETECSIGPVTAKGKGTLTGDFQTYVRTETEMVLTGIPGQTSPTPKKTVIEARRLGDCEPGQKPGDVIMPDGKVYHMPQGQ